MDAKTFIQQQFLAMRRLSAATIDGTTDAQLNWTPLARHIRSRHRRCISRRPKIA